MAENWSIRATDERERLMKRLKDATGENTKSGALDAAAKHFLADVQNKRMAIDDLDPDTAEQLSTPYIGLTVDVTRDVDYGE